eukprot:1708385-Amphidinium_carterae.1
MAQVKVNSRHLLRIALLATISYAVPTCSRTWTATTNGNTRDCLQIHRRSQPNSILPPCSVAAPAEETGKWQLQHCVHNASAAPAARRDVRSTWPRGGVQQRMDVGHSSSTHPFHPNPPESRNYATEAALLKQTAMQQMWHTFSGRAQNEHRATRQ